MKTKLLIDSYKSYWWELLNPVLYFVPELQSDEKVQGRQRWSVLRTMYHIMPAQERFKCARKLIQMQRSIVIFFLLLNYSSITLSLENVEKITHISM